MDILGQTSLLVAVTSFALGFANLSRNVRNKLFIAFAVLTALISAWSLAYFLQKMWPGGPFYRWHLFFNIWLAPAALAFVRIMVRIQDGFSRRLLDLGVASAVILSGALVLHFETEPAILQLIYFIPVIVTIQILRLMWMDHKVRHGGTRKSSKRPVVGLNRLNLIYIGGLIVMTTSVMDHVPWLGKAIPSMGNLLLSVYIFFISQAISQQRLLNFNALLSKTLVLLVVALTLTGLYSLLVAWIENSPALFFLNSFIVSFFILMLLDPLRKMVGYFTQILLGQKQKRLMQALREAQFQLTGIVDQGSLFQSVLTTAQHTLEPQWAALFVLRSDGTRFRRVRTLGDEPGKSSLKEILANHALLEYCDHLAKRGELPILLDQILESEIDRSASRVQREHLAALIQGLRALGCNLLIPLTDEGHILGFVTLMVSAPPELWGGGGGNWGLLRLIYPYFELAAHTLRNLEVYVKQREKERLATLGEMAAGLAHEIRNPLGAIKGAAQFLDPSKDKPESRFLTVIIEEVDRLNRVVTQFLDYSKPATTDFKPVDMVELVKKTTEMLRPSVAQSIQIEFFSPLRQASVMASAEQLQQVLINLIQNSVKSLESRSDGGRIQVRVDLDREGQHGGEVSLSVEDNGRGIKKEHLEKLFIPFFTTSPSGTGLGLSISQKILEAHRGRIDVATEEGRFARFTAILPYERGVK